MTYRYLDDATAPYGDDFLKNEARRSQWAAERKAYGFDEGETRPLKETFLTWMYGRIMLYREASNPDYPHWTFYYKDEALNQDQVFDRILEGIKSYCNVRDAGVKRFGSSIELQNNQVPLLGEIGELWSLVLPSL